MPFHLFALSPPFAVLLLEATPAFTRGEILTIIGVSLGAVYWIANRVNAVRDRKAAKQEALREQAVKERTEKIKRLETFSAEQQPKNTNFQHEIERLSDTLATALGQLKAVDDTSRDNRQKIENVKDSLARIEAQLSTLLASLLNRP